MREITPPGALFETLRTGRALLPLHLRDLGRTDYLPVMQAMQSFTESRSSATEDEFWLTEHERVFTQGQAGKAEHVLAPGDIPVVQTDRGGQVTYHGPGQIVGYLLFDVRRLGISVRDLVSGIEGAIVAVLAAYGIEGQARPDAPGVYVRGAKIASLGLRVRRGCSYHGLSLNVDMDLEPFGRINPCGLLGMQVTSMTELVGPVALPEVRAALVDALARVYGFSVRTPGTSGDASA
ncbi:MAG TPA: octanoyltransferase [Gammaproteobacteria bacterium]|jgi:lipoyl(octanoyl) transferase|nr:octanoyltransferase [Gammaproteobacteria bacterium]